MITITDREYEQLSDYIYRTCGITLGSQKKALIVSRLQNVLLQKSFGSFSDYYKYIVADKTGEATTALVDKITTNHTFFMREADHFEFFKDTVLPHLAGTVKNRDLRIWSAGCSSGEEPYTLAMIIQDYFGAEKQSWDTKVLATDISTAILDTAKKGEYPTQSVEALPVAWRNGYFKKTDGEKSAVVDKIKNEVIFSAFNLMSPVFPFKKKFHVIFCRNVMIYFNAETKRVLIDKFYDALEPGGYLFVGHSESLNRDETKFKYIKPAIYRKD
jgi:chemotaxis protein methyltransferase CheR